MAKLKDPRRQTQQDFYVIFSDVSFQMLTTFVFLLVTILITSRVAEHYQVPKLTKKVESTEAKLADAERSNEQLLAELAEMATVNMDAQVDQVLKNAGVGKKDFDLFVQGLKDLPGKDIHVVVDATGSMHGVVNFLIPVMRLIIMRSGKDLAAISWFADGKTGTYVGTMGETLDRLMQGAPFSGADETIGDAFTRIAKESPTPGAYLLIGDEPSDDRIYYRSIPAPVFTLPLGRSDPNTEWEYKNLSDKTGGKMLHLIFQ